MTDKTPHPSPPILLHSYTTSSNTTNTPSTPPSTHLSLGPPSPCSSCRPPSPCPPGTPHSTCREGAQLKVNFFLSNDFRKFLLLVCVLLLGDKVLQVCPHLGEGCVCRGFHKAFLCRLQLTSYFSFCTFFTSLYFPGSSMPVSGARAGQNTSLLLYVYKMYNSMSL